MPYLTTSHAGESTKVYDALSLTEEAKVPRVILNLKTLALLININLVI